MGACGRPPHPHTPTPAHSHTPILPLAHTPTLVIALLTILAAALRLVPYLAGYPLHRDEALYGFWARLIASGQDPLLLTTWIDKPPLVIYLLTAGLKLGGVSELALRAPGMLASVLLIPVTYALARRVYDSRTAALAALLLAASPFAILFAPTAFTDPWLTLWLVVAAYAAVSGRPFWAGVTVGLAVASKQQGVLVAPLVIGLLIVTNDERPTTDGQRPTTDDVAWSAVSGRRSAIIRHWFAAVLGFALILAPLTYWDSLRWHNRPSFWDRSLTTYGGIALAPLAEWSQRAVAWAEQLGYLWGAPLPSGIVLGLAAWGVTRKSQTANRKLQTANCKSQIANCKSQIAGRKSQIADHKPPFAILSAAFVLGYLALHFFLTFQPWDRYLLPLTPLVSVLAARGGVTIVAQAGSLRYRTDAHAAPDATTDEARHATGIEPSGGLVRQGEQPAKASTPERAAILGTGEVVHQLACVLLALLLGYAVWLGAAARIPVGSDHGAYAGLSRVVADVTGRPADAIIYHQSLGWYFDFYLFGAPQERRWFDTPARLIRAAGHTAEAEPGREQWLVATEEERAAMPGIETALAEHGLRLAERARIVRPDGSRSFTLYRILLSEATDG